MKKFVLISILCLPLAGDASLQQMFLNANARNGLPPRVAWWKLNEGSGTTANDSSGNGNTGTLSGGATFNAGGWLTLDGSSGYVSVGSSPTLTTLPFTYTAWVRVTNSLTHIWSTIIGGANDSHQMFLVGDYNHFTDLKNPITLAYADAADVVGQSTGTFVNGVWIHVAFTYDGSGNWVSYTNGVSAGSGNLGYAFSPTSATYLGIDYTYTDYYFNGDMKLVNIFNTALTASQVYQIYSLGNQ